MNKYFIKAQSKDSKEPEIGIGHIDSVMEI
jgi:hypothetical protein